MSTSRWFRCLLFILVGCGWIGFTSQGCGVQVTTETGKELVSESGQERNASEPQIEPTQEKSQETVTEPRREASPEPPQEPSIEPSVEPVNEPTSDTMPDDVEPSEDTDLDEDASLPEESSLELVPESPKESVSTEQTPTTPRCDLSNPLQDKYQAGSTYFGRNLYTKYVVGTLPIILSSPHGGSLKPSEIKDRTTGVLGSDSNSREYTLEVARRLYQLTGRLPHIVINRLHRVKLDANRAIKEASQGDTNSEKAWTEFRDYLLSARQVVTTRCKRGHYFDMHTNGHKESWVELGILLSAKDLALSNTVLDQGTTYKNKSSWRALLGIPGMVFSQLLRGPKSLGAMLQSRGYKTVPSPTYVDPKGGGFFSGGYNTVTYGSRNGGTVDGTQIETHYSMIVDSKRYNYARALAESILIFVEQTYGFKLRNPITTPAHSRCVNAKPLLFQQSVIDVRDSTWGALAEFPGKLNCGTTVNLNGPQLYYTFSVKAGTKYEIALLANYPARFYLFGDTCDVAQINTQCKDSGINGTLAVTGESKKVTYQPKKTSKVRLAVGSRYLHWLGRFRLTIKELP